MSGICCWRSRCCEAVSCALRLGSHLELAAVETRRAARLAILVYRECVTGDRFAGAAFHGGRHARATHLD